MTRPRVLALVGPTAAGKTALALRVAPELGAEVVSMDSAMVYRGMDIGTDKPSPADRGRVPHHLIDIVEPSHTLTVAEFQARARAAVASVLASGRVPLLVGGSGLYVRAVIDPFDFPATDASVRAALEAEAAEVGPLALYRRLEGRDPKAAALIDPANVRRTIRALEVIEVTGQLFSAFKTAWRQPQSVFELTLVGLTAPRPELDRRIEARVEAQIERGLVAEVEGLVAAGMRASATSVQALGYAQVLAYLDGACSLGEAVEAIKARTRRFARRQERWFGADPRVAWFNADLPGAAAALRAGREAA